MKTFYLLLLLAACLLLCKGTKVNIIHGREAVPHSRPYMALILFETYFEAKICGGTLIKANWVLTAGHCQMLGARITVILGAHVWEEGDQWMQEFYIVKTIPHPKYNKTNLNNDLRLIKLRGRATITKAVRILPLPETFQDLNGGSECQTAGWGKTETTDAAAKLMEVNVTILDRQKCTEIWKEKKRHITESMICTNVGAKGQDTCEGDSGGPLICNGVFTGMTSFGPAKCGQLGESSIFTRLTEEYIDWIHNTTIHN